MKSPPKKLVALVLKNMRTNPDEWEINTFHADNDKLGIEIWHENRYYGVKLSYGGMKWEGGAFLGWAKPWVRNFCREIDNIVIRRLEKKLNELIPDGVEKPIASEEATPSKGRRIKIIKPEPRDTSVIGYLRRIIR